MVIPALIAMLVLPLLATPAAAENRHQVVQREPVLWHPQSGNICPVDDDAVARLVRTRHGIRYRVRTDHLVAGNAYTMWFVVVNDPAECESTPCSPPTDIIGNAATDSQVTYGRSGFVARRSGRRVFSARFRAGPLLDGWLPVQGLDDPLGAEIHLIVNDHGPKIAELMPEMIRTYRTGCTDASLPAFFPKTAVADGTPGPNTCRLYQFAVFEPRA